jgi:hypothetical protein
MYFHKPAAHLQQERAPGFDIIRDGSQSLVRGSQEVWVGIY